MKRLLFVLSMLALSCAQAIAQTVPQTDPSKYIDEDPASIVTMQSIIDIQQDLTKREFYSQQLDAVWDRRGMFNLVYNNPATLSIKQAVPTESGKTGALYESKFGFSLQSGKNHMLHKKPIGNIVGINLDFLPLDLTVNKYASSGPTVTKLERNGGVNIRPWDNPKWEANYGMCLGPSITVAPFVPLKKKGLSFFKLNGYFHVGYSASLILFMDESTEKMNSLVADFGYGMYTSYGVNLSWKVLGFGYEHRSGTSKYRPISSDFGTEKYEMISTQDRLYINFRF